MRGAAQNKQAQKRRLRGRLWGSWIGGRTGVCNDRPPIGRNGGLVLSCSNTCLPSSGSGPFLAWLSTICSMLESNGKARSRSRKRGEWGEIKQGTAEEQCPLWRRGGEGKKRGGPRSQPPETRKRRPMAKLREGGGGSRVYSVLSHIRVGGAARDT